MFKNFQTKSGGHPASYSVGNEGKAAGDEGCPITKYFFYTSTTFRLRYVDKQSHEVCFCAV